MLGDPFRNAHYEGNLGGNGLLDTSGGEWGSMIAGNFC